MAAYLAAGGADSGALLLSSDSSQGSEAGGGEPCAVRLRGIRKRFGPTVALDGVDLTVSHGQVVALLGENGAGKSTLVKVLTGVIAPDEGEIQIEGKLHAHLTPRAAQDLGIARVAQELSLFPEMTVASNVTLGREPTRRGLIDRRAARRRAGELLDLLGVDIDPRLPVRALSLAERQLVEIAKAMATDPRILVLDEPTSGLRAREVEQLFAVVRRLRQQNRALIFISHRMEEVFAVADHIVVLKDGRNSGESARASARPEAIVRMMVGREVTSQFPPKAPAEASERSRAGDPALVAAGFSVAGTSIAEVDLTLRPGEVCGLAGLQGQGQTALLEALFGLRRATGRLQVGARIGPFRHPSAAVAASVALVPEDRKLEGGHLDLTVRENVTLPTLDRLSTATVVRGVRERERARGATAALGVRPADTEVALRSLSGGNQQKVVLAKWLETAPSVLLLADPTRGVDIATKQEMYRLIRDQANAGVAVLLLSTELTELIGLCDRVLVMSEGRIAGEARGDDLTEEGIMRMAMGADR